MHLETFKSGPQGSFLQMREGEAPSYFNAIEAAALVDLVQGLLDQHRATTGKPAVALEDIGVIATYRKQVLGSHLDHGFAVPNGEHASSRKLSGK